MEVSSQILNPIHEKYLMKVNKEKILRRNNRKHIIQNKNDIKQLKNNEEDEDLEVFTILNHYHTNNSSKKSVRFSEKPEIHLVKSYKKFNKPIEKRDICQCLGF